DAATAGAGGVAGDGGSHDGERAAFDVADAAAVQSGAGGGAVADDAVVERDDTGPAEDGAAVGGADAVGEGEVVEGEVPVAVRPGGAADDREEAEGGGVGFGAAFDGGAVALDGDVGVDAWEPEAAGAFVGGFGERVEAGGGEVDDVGLGVGIG